MSDKTYVIEQINKIHSLERKSSIRIKHEFTIRNEKDCLHLGERIKIKLDSYRERYDNLFASQKNYILLEDNSLITMYYIFDKKGKIMHHSLSYLPEVLDDDFSSNDFCENEIPDCFLFKNTGNYIRIDYTSSGYEEYFRSKTHMHVGLSNDKLRIPFFTYLYPNEFIYLILKYMYKNSDEKLLCISEFNIGKRVSTLSSNEIERLYAGFGKLYP